MLPWRPVCVTAIVLAALALAGCDAEGPDAALFNNANELHITGVDTGTIKFDHANTLMIVHLNRDPGFNGVPSARLTLDWTETDQQGNKMAVDHTTKIFLKAVPPGDYYACAFIDLNKNSKVDDNEPYAEWMDETGRLKIVPVKKESRWKLRFVFTRTYAQRDRKRPVGQKPAAARPGGPVEILPDRPAPRKPI